MRVTLVGLIIGALSVAPPVTGQERSPLVVAEVRADGLILPVGIWQNGAWQPAVLQKGRVADWYPRRWQFTDFAGRRDTLRVGNAMRILDDEMGYDDWGFTTDLKNRSFEPDYRPIDRVGIATTRPVTMRLFSALSANDARQARAALRQLLDSAKAATDPRQLANLLPLSPADTFTLKADAARSASGVLVLDASADLPIGRPAGDSLCPMVMSYGGWAIIQDGRVTLEGTPRLTNCEHKESGGVSATALLEIQGRTFVMGAETGWEERTKVIWELKNGRLVTAVKR